MTERTVTPAAIVALLPALEASSSTVRALLEEDEVEDPDEAVEVAPRLADLSMRSVLTVNFPGGDSTTIHLLTHREGWGILVDDLGAGGPVALQPVVGCDRARVSAGVRALLVEHEGWTANQFGGAATLSASDVFGVDDFGALVAAAFEASSNNDDFATPEEYLAAYPPYVMNWEGR